MNRSWSRHDMILSSWIAWMAVRSGPFASVIGDGLAPYSAIMLCLAVGTWRYMVKVSRSLAVCGVDLRLEGDQGIYMRVRKA